MTKSFKKGGCHCGAVQWQAKTEDRVTVQACNCSMCDKTGYLHLIVPAADFELLTGSDQIETYTFNTKVAQHKFCKVCGIKSFYIPRSNPDGVSLNLRCMDRQQFDDIEIEPFDGVNWEEHAHSLADLSKE